MNELQLVFGRFGIFGARNNYLDGIVEPTEKQSKKHEAKEF